MFYILRCFEPISKLIYKLEIFYTTSTQIFAWLKNYESVTVSKNGVLRLKIMAKSVGRKAESKRDLIAQISTIKGIS